MYTFSAASLDGVSIKIATLDSIIEDYGFIRVELPTMLVVDLFAVDDSLRFRKSPYYSKYVEWFISNVSRDEVVEIYSKLGMTFKDIDNKGKQEESIVIEQNAKEMVMNDTSKELVKVKVKRKDK